jgi:cell division protein FtsW (lipid II flippase)
MPHAHVADRLRSSTILGTFAAGAMIMKMPDAAERKVLIVTTFVSACIALAPQEWTSAGVLLVASALMYFNDRRLTKREKAAKASLIVVITEPVAPLTASEEPPAELASIAAETAPRAESAAPPAAL